MLMKDFSLEFNFTKNKLRHRYEHSHKKRLNSLETGTVFIEISMLSWNLTNSSKYGGLFLKKALSEGNQLFAGGFRALLTSCKVFKYWVFSGPYFTAFRLNTERYSVSVRIQSQCRKIRTRKNSVFGHFSRSVGIKWTLVCFNLQINGTGNELFSIKETFEESFQLQLSVLHQSMCILKTSLSSLSDG